MLNRIIELALAYENRECHSTLLKLNSAKVTNKKK